MFPFEKILLVQGEFNCVLGPTSVDYAAIAGAAEQGYIESGQRL